MSPWTPRGCWGALLSGFLLTGCATPRPPPNHSSASLPSATPILGPKEGLEADPWRLDLRFHQLTQLQEQGRFEEQYSYWVDTLQRDDKDWRRWTWEDGGKLPKRSSRLIPPRLEEDIRSYLGQGSEEGTERALRISKLALTYYPGHPEFQRSRAFCYLRRGDPGAALRCLLRLLAKDPGDLEDLLAMGDVLWDSGKEKEARVYYRKAVDQGGPPDRLAEARQRLGLVETP